MKLFDGVEFVFQQFNLKSLNYLISGFGFSSLKQHIDRTDFKFLQPNHFLFLHWHYWLVAILVFLISLATHVINIQHPPDIVFDETHFGGFITDYVNGICFFDIHPPLAKLMFYGVAKLTGYDGKYNFSSYPNRYTSDFYVSLRLLPAISASLISPILTLTLGYQGCSLLSSFFVGFTLSFEFTLISQTRLILTDGILYFFVSLVILFTTLNLRFPSWKMIFFQSLFAGCAISVKFTAASVLIFIAISHLISVYRLSDWFLILCIRGIFIGLISFSVLFVSLFFHIKFLPYEGFGDRYMASDFRQHWIVRQIFELLIAMFNYNKNLSQRHPFESRWYTWPFSLAPPMPVWGPHASQQLMFFNSPSIAFLSFVGYISTIFTRNAPYFFGYAFSYFPFILISRCTWTYHYEIALIFGITSLSMSINRMRFNKLIIAVLSILNLLCYALWFPWIYGNPVSFERMLAIDVWRNKYFISSFWKWIKSLI